MIPTVTLNAALDVTWGVADLRPRESHRVDSAHERAAGKGVNVARVLELLGHTPVVTGLVGGPTGWLIRDDLRGTGVRERFAEVAGDSRRTLTMVSRADGDATVFNGRGPHVTPTEWESFARLYSSLLPGVRVVVLSSSTPPGPPVDAHARLIRTAAAAGAVTVPDTSGPALLAALKAGPDVGRHRHGGPAATGRLASGPGRGPARRSAPPSPQHSAGHPRGRLPAHQAPSATARTPRQPDR